MNSDQEIKYLKNKDINTVLWNKCISQSQNGNIFAFSWYLDAVCKKWDALVVGNYDAVLPLPIKKNAGITKLIQPKFFNKTNLYISNEIKTEISKKIISKKISDYKIINLRTENPEFINSKKYSEKKSYKIDLISPYEIAKNNFSEKFNKNIETSYKNKIFYNTGILPNGLVLLSSLEDKFNKSINNKLRLISAVSIRKNKGEIIGAFNDKNILIAAILFISSHHTANIVYSVQSKEAKYKKALCGLINNYIKTHSETAVTLDFFGLNIKNINLKDDIGAKEYPYYNIKKRFLF